MTYFFDPTSVYGPDTAIIRGNLTIEDIQRLIDDQISSVALNGAFGWTSKGLDLLPRLLHLKKLDILAYEKTNIDCIAAIPSLEELYLGAHTHGGLSFQKLTSLKTFRFHDGQLRLSFSNFSAAGSLITVAGNPSAAHIKGLAEVSNLKNLELSSKNLEDLSWLKNFKLKFLDLSGCNKLSKLDGIDTQKDLDFLMFGDSRRILNLNELSTCTSLKFLMFDECGKLDSLTPLAGLHQLNLVSFLGDTNILDGRISAIDECKNLQQVRFVDRKHYDKKKAAYSFSQDYFHAGWKKYFAT